MYEVKFVIKCHLCLIMDDNIFVTLMTFSCSCRSKM